MELLPTHFPGSPHNPSARRSFVAAGLLLGLSLWLCAFSAQADNRAIVFQEGGAHRSESVAVTALDLTRPHNPVFGSGYLSAQVYESEVPEVPASRAVDGNQPFKLYSSRVARYQLDQGTRMTGWRFGDEVFFGRSKGDLSGVALIWQRSQTDQVSLSGSGLRLTRRIN